MKQANLISSASKAGVKISVLAEVCGCSHQMARRYVLGEALPEIDVTYKIAKWLKVSPGWLLFGEDTEVPNNINQNNLIQIEPDLFEYILTKSSMLFELTKDTKELVHFIMDSVNDATHIKADKKELMKIIDISVSSAMRFNGIKNDRKTKVS
ncbi:helix-turn-helix transcriptional regulator [Legionella lytica]|jgi:transcriptional regulator with XRE-family HTH domain|uniref:Helix-turn-helix transcriptional regulator n=1 Tax=Legionella lytica TaxID=96232 RepID=A0ABY4Y7L6_9GAMM|nr:helix-turn-helix transcriptional regulator [Legionella lytica]USQ13629.1 helix-turn-helix transcriptional regulator [Legionella lytica]